MKILRASIVLSLALLAAPALAQESIVLEVETGSVWVSTPTGFVAASSSLSLEPGQRVMLSEGSKVNLNYPGGCAQSLGAAGVFTVQATCVAPPQLPNAAPTGVSAAGVAAGLSATAVLSSMDDSDSPQPISR